MGGDRDTWWKYVGNELRRFYNGIDKWVRSTNTIEFIRNEEVLKRHTFTY